MNSKIVITIIAQPLRDPPTRQGEATAREAAAPLTLCLIGGNSLPLKAAPDGSNAGRSVSKRWHLSSRNKYRRYHGQ